MISNKPIHFLHIGKTGGTALAEALRPIAEERNFIFHPHSKRLVDVPGGEAVIFSIRHPLGRFVSGFNSRLRRGQPRYSSEWRAGEAEVFARFPTPNALAEALSSADVEADRAARRAMLTVEHVRSSYSDWLHDLSYVEERDASILFVLAQETLDSDFAALKVKLNLPLSLQLPEDEIASHRTPAGYDSTLSELALRNLGCWYAKELAFHERLQALREARLPPRSPTASRP